MRTMPAEGNINILLIEGKGKWGRSEWQRQELIAVKELMGLIKQLLNTTVYVQLI